MARGAPSEGDNITICNCHMMPGTSHKDRPNTQDKNPPTISPVKLVTRHFTKLKSAKMPESSGDLIAMASALDETAMNAAKVISQAESAMLGASELNITSQETPNVKQVGSKCLKTSPLGMEDSIKNIVMKLKSLKIQISSYIVVKWTHQHALRLHPVVIKFMIY